MLKRKDKRIQPRRLLSFSLVVLLFSLVLLSDFIFIGELKAQPFTPLPEPKFPQSVKKTSWADSFRKAETLRMNSPSESYTAFLRIVGNCKDSSILAPSYYRLSQSENQLAYAENFINKALQLYPEQEDFLMMKASILEKSFKFNESWPIRSQLIRLKPRYISRYKEGIYTATMAGFDDSADQLRNKWQSEFGGTPPQGFTKFKKTPLSNKSVETVHNELNELEKKILGAYSARDSKTFLEFTDEFETIYPFLSNHLKCHTAMYFELSNNCSEAKKLWHEIGTNSENIPSIYQSLQHLCP